MAKGKEKRQKLFDKFSNQLHRLIELKLYDIDLKFDKTFICPICLKQFSDKDLDTALKNHLTLEDAPPKSLGGKANTLTCKKCNNEFGHTIDFHLVDKLNELGIKSFSPNTDSKVKTTHDGIEVQGTLKVDEKGVMTITYHKKTNNPDKLKEYLSKTAKGDIVNLNFPISRVDIRRFEIALLKSAYMMAFEQYGYALILNKSYDIVRKQLLNPDDEIYPKGFWSQQSVFTESSKGVHLIATKGFEGFQAIFVLETKKQNFGYGVYLPISNKNLDEIMRKLTAQKAGFSLKYQSYLDFDYFNDDDNLIKCVAFLDKQNS